MNAVSKLFTREEVAFCILGRRKYLRLSRTPRSYWAAAYVAVAMEARDPEHAGELALELADALDRGARYWRGNVVISDQKLLEPCRLCHGSKKFYGTSTSYLPGYVFTGWGHCPNCT